MHEDFEEINQLIKEKNRILYLSSRISNKIWLFQEK